MDFAVALEKAITIQRRKGVLRAVGTSALTVLALLLSRVNFGGDTRTPSVLFLFEVLGLILLVNGVAWYVALMGSPALKGLKKLRGGRPEQWLPSPSHGLVVATSEALLSGALPRAELNRFDRCRVTSISYQEAEHALTVDVTTMVPREGAESAKGKRWVIKLASSVTPEHAYSFAKHVLALSQR